MKSGRSSRLAVGLTSLALLALPGRALALKYKPKADETLAHIARIHYGHSKKVVYLSAVNGIADPNQLPPGKTLWVPTVRKHKVRRGEDLARVARKYLKDAQRADFLMWLNQIDDARNLKIGAWLVIPFLIRHRVQQGETMLDLARKYYWQTKPAGLLRKFNKKRTNALTAGEIVIIPIYDKEAHSDKVQQRLKRYQAQEAQAAQEARERARRQAVAKQPDAPEDAADQDEPEVEGDPPVDLADPVTEAISADVEGDKPSATTQDNPLIREAFGLFRDGEYELARANLIRLLEQGGLPAAQESRAREVLAHCLVALDLVQEAEYEFVRLLMVDPDRQLDPITTSPKVLEVFRKARGSR